MPDLVRLKHPVPRVALVTLHRPEKYNALSNVMLDELAGVVDGLATDPDLRAVVLTGAGPAFCAGVDLDELGVGVGFSTTSLDALRSLSVPVIGAVNGVAITGGLELALACDLRIASQRARFADTHARVGAIPGWGLTARLPQAVGDGWARQMSFTGDFVDASTALRIGLVNDVVAHDTLVPRALELAGRMTETLREPALRIRTLYNMRRDGTGQDAIDAERSSGASFSVDDLDSFAGRRAAVFERGRAQ